MAKVVDYKKSGVNVNEGYRAVDKYKKEASRAKVPGVLTRLTCRPLECLRFPKELKNPVMVSGTDGVGTKLDVAFQMKKYDTVGIDCVAMSVNDILCSGVQPLFFLDYVACGKLDADVAADLVKGVADGCVDTGCALLGGETAEMPGFYDVGKYDLAGFGVGVGEKKEMITGEDIREGDVLIGLSSTGVHSNGFLTPTRIYVKPVMEVLGKYRKSIHGMVHVTGGGFYENIPRMYPKAKKGKKQLISVIKRASWDIPPVFGELIRRGADFDNVYNTFNMGIGFVLAVKKADAEKILAMFNKNAKKYHKAGIPDMKAYAIGYVGHTDKAIRGEFKGSKQMTRFVNAENA